jgi:ABC-type sugar transport system ATPase subunit
MAEKPVPVIEMINIVKKFPGVVALDKMSIDLFPGEIHSLVGENGAGKSTLMKVLSGAYKPDGGTIIINGSEYSFLTSASAKQLGIGIIYQENLLVPWTSIVENIFTGQELGKGGIVNFKDQHARAQELCDYIGIKLNLQKTIATLSVAEQQYVKILKALSTDPQILIMDEPTSMFNTENAKLVLDMVKRIAANGVSIIYISHFLKEVKQIADRITVIRDGVPIRTYDNKNSDVDLDKVVSDMVGRDASMFYEKERHPIGEKLFEVKDLKVEPNSEPISFYAKRGEILGLAGMVGSGRTEIADAITGASTKYGGSIWYNGNELKINSPIDSIKNRIAYITEDRQKKGLTLHAPIVENLTIVGMQTEKIKSPIFNVKKFVPLVRGIIEKLKIKTSNPMQEVQTLSGGNQQKVVLGKWLFTDSDIFIFDEPTRGIDVNAKFEFYKIISQMSKEGKVVIMISSDMPEIVSMSDRMLVVRNGLIAKTLESDEISENSIIRYALGVQNDENAS